MQELGQWLKKTRVELGITLVEMEEKTKIRQRYLEAIEAGDMKSLPEPVYTLGFLRSYARQINVDENQVAQYYKDWQASQNTSIGEENVVLQQQPAKGKKQIPTKTNEENVSKTKPVQPVYGYTETRDRRFAKGFVWVILIVIVIGALVALYVVGKRNSQNDTPITNPPAAQQPINQEPQIPEDVEPIIDEPVNNEPTGDNAVAYEGVNLTITAETDNCWLGITVDGEYSEDTIEKGMRKVITGNELVKVRYGSAGAVTVVFNGVAMDPIGKVGEVKTVEYPAP